MTTRPVFTNRRDEVKMPTINWSIDVVPQRLKIYAGPQHMRNPQNKDWQEEILPGRNFSIIYPFARYGEINPTIPYEAEGQPVTLLDLLTTIYEFYQEPIPINEKLILHEEDPDIYTPDLEKRIDAMFSLTFFEGIDRVGQDTYRLRLSS